MTPAERAEVVAVDAVLAQRTRERDEAILRLEAKLNRNWIAACAAAKRVAELEFALAERTLERDEAIRRADCAMVLVAEMESGNSTLRNAGVIALERAEKAEADRDAAIRRAEAAEEDAERLDWLDARCARDAGHTMMNLGAAVSTGLLPPQRGPFNARAAIDAARAQELQR